MSDETVGEYESRMYSVRAKEATDKRIADQLAALTQERDALREAMKELLQAGSFMADRLFLEQIPKWDEEKSIWHKASLLAIMLLAPPAGAGNGKEVGK
jgi:hypothetical protein